MCLVPHQPKQVISSPHLLVKNEDLYQLMWVRAWHCNVSINWIPNGFTGTSKVRGRSTDWSLACMSSAGTEPFMMNSTTTLASHWTLKIKQITWRYSIFLLQTQPSTTVWQGMDLTLSSQWEFLLAWRLQVWPSRLWFIGQHLKPTNQEALYLWAVHYALGTVV